MTWTQLLPMTPELILAAVFGAVLLLDTFPRVSKTVCAWLAGLGMAGALVLTVLLAGRPSELFSGAFLSDPLSVLFKIVFLGAGLLVLASSTGLARRLAVSEGQYYGLLVCSVLGMMFLASAGEMVMLFVALELATLPLYVLAAFHRDEPASAEAGLKYYLIGALSSAVLLYGLSLLYGMTGTTRLSELGGAAAAMSGQPAMAAAILFIAAGIAFKLGAVPFHMWVPDVYQGAPVPVTAFLSVASKSAGFAVLLRLLTGALGQPGLREDWTFLFAVMAALAMILGNLVAMHQTDMKRFLAYSSIAQAGYLLTAVPAASLLGTAAVLFYLLIYLFTNLAAFIVVIWFTGSSGSDRIEDYAGLSRKAPAMSLAMLLALLSLAGIPPLGGFAGKFTLFAAAWEGGYEWLVVLGVVMSVISVYYYLMVIRRIYLEAPGPAVLTAPALGPRIALVIAVLGILATGCYPGPFLDLSMMAAQVLFR